jgi:choline dehydrogenase-like flavoprotein
VVIIGAGPAGASVASRLIGFEVICLEQGTYSNKNQFPLNFMNWEHLKYTSFNPDPNIRNSKYDYPINNSDSAISVANYNGVGGSTILFSGQYPRFHPSDFKVKSLDGISFDWPIEYSDLEPYYELDSSFTAIAGLEGDPAYPPIKNLLPPVELGKMGITLANTFSKLDWHWWPSYSAISTRKFGDHKACENLGSCNTGCPIGAKSSADISYWTKNLAEGVQLITEARVTEIILKNRHTVSGVKYTDSKGQEKIIKAKIVVVAASGVGTPRILLNSKSLEYPDGLANKSGMVGKNLMLHPLGYVEGLFDEYLDSSHGPQGCCITSQEFYDTDMKRNFYRGYTMQILRGPGPTESAISGIMRNQINWGDDFHKQFKEIYNKTAHMAIISEDLPEEHNMVTLDKQLKDKVGMPAPKISYRLSENTKKMLAHGVSKGKELMLAAGAKRVQSFAPVRHTGWHLMGTARMGIDPTNSVVNKDCQAHDIENLFITDSSVFVTSAGVNPAATINAIGLRAGDEIRSRLMS